MFTPFLSLIVIWGSRTILHIDQGYDFQNPGRFWQDVVGVQLGANSLPKNRI